MKKSKERGRKKERKKIQENKERKLVKNWRRYDYNLTAKFAKIIVPEII